MTIHVKLSPETEAKLAAEARVKGVSVEQVAERILHDALVSFAAVQSNDLTVAEFHAMLAAVAEGSERLPNLATESFTRASFYEERA